MPLHSRTSAARHHKEGAMFLQACIWKEAVPPVSVSTAFQVKGRFSDRQPKCRRGIDVFRPLHEKEQQSGCLL
ncbi:MAG: hypothetical protein J5855_00865 [Mailhella sp.]|nr:hypothetical protein [Mailhella sp.]